MNIFVGNLTPEVNDTDLEDIFGKYGKVKSAKVIRDMFSQQSKGFGFVEMMNNREASDAIQNLNVSELKGKMLVVNEARSLRERGKKGRRR